MANPYRDNPDQYNRNRSSGRYSGYARPGQNASRPSSGGGDYGNNYGNNEDYDYERDFNAGSDRNDRYRNYDAQIEQDETAYRYWRNHYGGESSGDYASALGDRAGRERYGRELGRERERYARLNRGQEAGNANTLGSPYGDLQGQDRYSAPYAYGSREGSRYAGYGSQRDWWDRTRDEVSSWFGDDAAEHRRELDHARDEYYGRGPKTYTRSDERILEDVNDRLTGNSTLDVYDIEALVKDGEVTLNGTVSGRYAKRQAEDIAHNVSGVKHVQNNLRFREQASTSVSAAGTAPASGTAAGTAAGTATGVGRNAH